MPIEYEAKFMRIDKDAFRHKLAGLGYRCTLPEHLFRRQTFDLPGEGLGKWGRVRWEHDVINLSIKHTVDPLRVDGTHETLLNIPLGEDPAQQYHDAIAFLQACGLIKQGEQENYREIWVRGEVEICLDTWPGLLPFAEIEGPDEQSVRDAAAELGLDFGAALFGGVTAAYEDELGISPAAFHGMGRVAFDEPPV